MDDQKTWWNRAIIAARMYYRLKVQSPTEICSDITGHSGGAHPHHSSGLGFESYRVRGLLSPVFLKLATR